MQPHICGVSIRLVPAQIERRSECRKRSLNAGRHIRLPCGFLFPFSAYLQYLRCSVPVPNASQHTRRKKKTPAANNDRCLGYECIPASPESGRRIPEAVLNLKPAIWQLYCPPPDAIFAQANGACRKGGVFPGVSPRTRRGFHKRSCLLQKRQLSRRSMAITLLRVLRSPAFPMQKGWLRFSQNHPSRDI